MRVPFLDLGAAHRELADEIDEAIARTLASNRFVLGPELERFEAEFASYCGVAHGVGVGNGLDALRLGLQALGVGPGDEVVVPAHTFIATWLAVSSLGATPVPVEPVPGGFQIDPDGVAAAIGPRTRAVVVVHLYGEPADVDAIRRVAGPRGLPVVEDAAQAHGARLRGRRVGGLGDLAAFSFYPGKNLAALGDGGAVVTREAGVAERVRRLRNYGALGRIDHELAGCNSRLDELQAAVLRVKLRRLDAWNDRRRRRAAEYARGLEGLGLQLPRPAADTEPVWHLYVVRSDRRDGLRAALDRAGIETGIHYAVPPHHQGAFADLGPLRLPRAERLAREVLSLPIGPHLGEASQARVVQAIEEARGRSRAAVSLRQGAATQANWR